MIKLVKDHGMTNIELGEVTKGEVFIIDEAYHKVVISRTGSCYPIEVIIHYNLVKCDKYGFLLK